jgi:hypothetical protein
MQQGKYTLMMSNLLISSMETGVMREMNRKLINNFALVYIVNLIFGFMIALVLVYIRMYLEETLLFFTLPFLSCYLLVSSYLLWHIDDLNDAGNKQQSAHSSPRGMRALLSSIADMETTSRRKLLLLLPYHVAWGINTAFWILYLVRNIFYDEISFLAAAYALFLSYLFSLLYTLGVKTICPHLNHNCHILIGGLSSFCLGIFALSMDGFTKHEAREDYRIVVVFSLLYGISMSVYENNMRAEVANLLQHYEVIAYSATSFSKTISAGVCLISSTIILNKGRDDAGRFGLEVELIISSVFGIVGFISAVLIDRRGSTCEVVEELEEKLLRENERINTISDLESLYTTHKSVRGDAKFPLHRDLRSDNNPSIHSSNMLSEEDCDNYSSSRASSSVAEDEFFVPDYF